MLVKFESVEAFARAVRSEAMQTDYMRSRRSLAWDAGLSGKETIKRCIQGDPTMLEGIGDLSLDVEGRADTQAFTRIADYYGTSVNVSAYLAGDPYCMRRKVKAGPSKFVTIYCAIACASGVAADTMLRRGRTILSFLEYLQASNVGVDLYLVTHHHGETDGDYHHCIRVETRPLDLSVSAFAIAHPAVVRKMSMGLATVRDGYDGSFARSYGPYRSDPSAYVEVAREVFDMGPSDIYIPVAEHSDLLVNNPQQWLAEHIAKANGTEGDHV